MKKHVVLAGFMTVVSTLAGVAEASAAQGKPNIVVILADDMGYGDCGVYNPQSRIRTPHIDQLAKEGLRFTDAHSAGSTCTPSRYGLLTGINPTRTGVLNTLLSRGEPIIAEHEKTIAEMLRDQGYVTRMVGKWHLGFAADRRGKRPVLDFAKPLEGGPVDRGFDSFFGMPSSPGASPLCFIRGRHVVDLPTEQGIVKQVRGDGRSREVKVMMSPGYRPEDASPAFCREAIKLIRAHAASNESRPLFLTYASPIPHQPWAPSARFEGKSGLGDYADFMMQLDDVVGKINQALKETGLDENTLLIFTSDNGPGPWAVQAMAATGHASAGGLRGKKSDSWEGGHRVPFIAKWPGRVAPNTHTTAVINFTDLFATLAEVLQVDPAKNTPGSSADSHSFLPILLDPSQSYRRQGMMVHRGAIRQHDWKLVSKQRVRNMEAVKGSQFELFDLAKDPSEQHDLSQTHPEKAKQLFSAFKRFANSRDLK